MNKIRRPKQQEIDKQTNKRENEKKTRNKIIKFLLN